MAQQTKKRPVDRARYTFTLLMLSVVLVFGFGLILGQTQGDVHQAESVQRAVTSETESASEEVPLTEPGTEQPVQNVRIPAENTPEFHQATSFWSNQPHIYLRVSHEKQLELTALPEFDMSDAVYGVSDENVAVVDEFGMITGVQKGECTVSVFCGAETLRIPVTVRELVVVDGCTYVDGILIANKTYSLPEDYDPGMLPETLNAFEELQADASAQGLNIYQGSGYRSYQYQITVYKSMCDAYGEEYASQVSARPGYSEHQTGYTIDCNTIENGFALTPAGQWLAQHAHEYGFIIRYPEGKEDITGYAYESWHIRYVGVEAATEIYEQGLTLEEYLDVLSVPEEAEEETAPETMPEWTETPNPGYEYEPETDVFSDVPEDMPEEIPEQTPADDGVEFIDAPLQAPN